MKAVGRLAIRGAFGAPVQTDVVLLSIKPAVSGTNEINIAPPLEVMFAVCEELNECIILTADTVNKLELLQHYNVMNVPDNIVIMASTVVEEVDDQSESSVKEDIIPLDGSSDPIGSTTSVISPDRIIGSSPDN